MNNTATVTGSGSSNVTSSGSVFGRLTLTNSNTDEREQLSAADIRMFKEMCGLLDYIASVDPKFKEYMMAYKAKQRILR
jgi:hypothetical protein